LEVDEVPTTKFQNAFQAFSSYVATLLDLPLGWQDITVRSLALKEEKNGGRGLQVSFMRKIPKANDKPIVVTTPYLVSPPTDYNGDGKGYLNNVTLELITDIEAEAVLYRSGERGEQTALALSSNAADFDEAAAHAENVSTRKGKKGPDDAALLSLMAGGGYDVPVDAIGRWTSSERDGVVRFLHLTPAKRAKATEPACLTRDSTAAMFEGPPPKVSKEGAATVQQAAKAAVERG
jgi:hypothetical protein